MKASDLWKAIYNVGDKVWVTTKAGIYPGQVVGYGVREHPVKTPKKTYRYLMKLYYVAAPEYKLATLTNRVIIRVLHSQLFLRQDWEREPLENMKKDWLEKQEMSDIERKFSSSDFGTK